MMVLNIYDGNKSMGIICSLCALCLSVCRTESVAEKMLTNWFTFLLYKFLKVTFKYLFSTSLNNLSSTEKYTTSTFGSSNNQVYKITVTSLLALLVSSPIVKLCFFARTKVWIQVVTVNLADFH